MDEQQTVALDNAVAALAEMVKWFGAYPEFVPNPNHSEDVANAIARAKAVVREHYIATGK